MLSAREKYSYGIGALGKDLGCSIVFVYIMFYFTDIVGLDPMFVGSVMFFARFWDAINDTIMGVLVDNTSSKFGKFLPWILVGTVINAIAVIFLFKNVNITGSAQAYYYAAMYIIWGMTYTMMDIPYWSMLPTLSQNPQERNKIAVIPRIFASIAWFLMGTFGLQTIGYLGEVGSLDGGEKIVAQRVGFERFAILIAVIFVICSVVTVLNVKERESSTAPKEKVSLKRAKDVIFKNDQLLAFIGILLAFNLITQLSGGVALYYFKYAVGNEEMFSLYQAYSGIAEISGLLLFPIIAKKLSRTMVYAIACSLPVFGLGLLIISGMISPEARGLVAISGIIYKLGGGLSLGASTVMLADVVDYGELKLNSRNESIVFSIQTMLVKFASAISGYLVGVGLTFIGYIPNVEQTEQTIMGIRVLMGGIPGLLSILSFVIFVKFFKIKGEFHTNMLEELAKRQINANHV